MIFGKMKIFIVIAVVFISAFAVQAQMREVIIENTGLLECIQDAIKADLAANGEDVVNNTKYILRRGETYVHSTQYQPNHKVWLEAEPGDKPLPRILGVNTGGEAPRMVRSTNNMTFIGIRYEGLDSDGNHTDNSPLRQRGTGTTCTVKNCIFSDHRLEVFRVDGKDQKWIIENNMLTRIHQKDFWNKGYAFSFMNNRIDSFIVRNNTIFNSPCGIMHSDLTQGGKYFEFSGNTLHNLGGLYQGYVYENAFEAALINFGFVQNVVCKDNLIINCMTFGYLPRWADSISVINVNLTDSTGKIEVSNNNIWRDPEFEALNPDSVEMIKWFDAELASLIGDGSAFGFISEPVAFKDVPEDAPMKAAVTAFFSAPDAIFNPDAISLDETPDPADVNYGYVGKMSPTASSTGGPLGAKKWHASVTVGVEDTKNHQPANSFTLHGNYPNPFNPATTIQFDLASNAIVKLNIINTLGQIVYESEEEVMAGNNREIKLDAKNWVSGLYIYKLNIKVGNQTQTATGRMLLLK
ncbi:T9SS type A sorting domain-containing protein [candidate division KSB1 bacterium]|nr:T9SS type A sorting domain-containing protein [candidate division KSB1 bacterium]